MKKCTRTTVMAALLVGASTMVGCATAPQTAVPASGAVLSGDAGKIGVITTAMPKPDTEFPGAGCLLCYAAASAANSSLTAYTHTLSTDEVLAYKSAAIAALKSRGVDVVDLPGSIDLNALPDFKTEEPNFPKKNFTGLKQQYGVEHLAVIDVSRLGFDRQYSAYIPNGGPNAVVRGQAFIVDLSTNAYDWFEPINAIRGTEGEWDEPPGFPGLTNAYFQAIEMARDELINPIKR